MGIKVETINGPVQNIEKGDGIQVNDFGDLLTSPEGIIQAFTKYVKTDKRFDETFNGEAKEAVEKTIKDLEAEVAKDAPSVKKGGVDVWLKRIQLALSSVASGVAIANAPWWGAVATFITNCISKI